MTPAGPGSRRAGSPARCKHRHSHVTVQHHQAVIVTSQIVQQRHTAVENDSKRQYMYIHTQLVFCFDAYDIYDIQSCTRFYRKLQTPILKTAANLVNSSTFDIRSSFTIFNAFLKSDTINYILIRYKILRILKLFKYLTRFNSTMLSVLEIDKNIGCT